MVKFGELPCSWCKYEEHGQCLLSKVRLNATELARGLDVACANWRTKTKKGV